MLFSLILTTIPMIIVSTLTSQHREKGEGNIMSECGMEGQIPLVDPKLSLEEGKLSPEVPGATQLCFTHLQRKSTQVREIH